MFGGIDLRVVSGQWLVVRLFFLMTLALSAQELKVESFDGQNWEGIQKREVKVDGYKESLQIQTAKTEKQLYLRVRIPQKTPSFKHRPWVLKDEKLVVGQQQEDSLALRFSQKGKAIKDVWFWGANRTQWGFADDGLIKGGQYVTDKGLGPWKLNLRRETLHQNRSRYLKQQVTESRGDVRVKASHNEGAWEIIFIRSLKTNHQDDLEFSRQIEVALSKSNKSSVSRSLILIFMEQKK